MTDAEPAEQTSLFPKTIGEKLRETRESQGLSLADVAARTKVPVRQLEAIERMDYAALPSVTYAVGFAKAYARAIGADEVAVAREVRAHNDQHVRRTEYEVFEITDPKRLPNGQVVIGGVVVALLLTLAVGLWYGTSLFRGEDPPPAAPVAAASEIAPPVTAPEPPPVPAGSQVTLTATDEVWMRVYDATGKTLFQGTMKQGDRYDVPADANGPMINVGRPDKLQVTLNGSIVPPLGDGRVAISDVGISGQALLARANPAAATASSTTGAQAPTSQPSTTPTRTTTPSPGPTTSATTDASRPQRRAAAGPDAAQARPATGRSGGNEGTGGAPASRPASQPVVAQPATSPPASAPTTASTATP